MNRPRILRLLRIAASVVCLIVCGLLIVLWVRSYKKNGMIIGDHWNFVDSSQGFVNVYSGRGSIFVNRTSFDPTLNGWRAYSAASSAFLGFGICGGWQPLSVKIPYWFPLLFSGALAAVLGIRRSYRFSLRTLLIATMFVAVVLGLIVAFSR